ncbi:protein of unknown function [Salinimicrobium catena]|uniref:DUF4402 domain-containing protein n=1 Tax=Salinimicrobium catena TaxID=390640 RepID=A0A1H5LTC1_9FLAO|nr:DUF4402 domain-containing protein [Salinimicrobium catena]SDL14170.1 protein of unknown function [Salinimicrobium catena]SEE80302.1 protein of unknown function [Salinimicrobium catena]
MKKITFILLVLLTTGTAFGQTTVSTAAEIIEAITFTEASGLNFGKVDNTAGTVIIDFDGTPSGTKSQITGGSPSAAVLNVTGEASESYNIILSSTATLSGPGPDMNVTEIAHDANQTLDVDGKETVNIGGKLTVGTNQIAGSYSGSISITVSYN